MDFRTVNRGHSSNQATRKPLQDTTATANNYSPRTPVRHQLKPQDSSYTYDVKPQQRPYNNIREGPSDNSPQPGVISPVTGRHDSQYPTASPTTPNLKHIKFRKDKARVGPWILGRTLGKGSSGRVRLAKHTGTGKLAAIKIVAKDQEENSLYEGQTEGSLALGLEREVVIMKLINHPNVIGLLDVWENRAEL